MQYLMIMLSYSQPATALPTYKTTTPTSVQFYYHTHWTHLSSSTDKFKVQLDILSEFRSYHPMIFMTFI